MHWAFDYVQRDGTAADGEGWSRDNKGGSVYLRLSTRPIDQINRTLDPVQRRNITDGGYWMRKPNPSTVVCIVAMGAVMPEAIEAAAYLGSERASVGVLAVTSADRLSAGWHGAQRSREQGERTALSHVEDLLSALPRDAAIVTICDAHPETLSWIGAVHGHRVRALGPEQFGQSGSIPELYAHYGMNVDAIVQAGRSMRRGI